MIVGALVLVVGAVMLAYAFAGSPFATEGYLVHARFSEVDGLSRGSEVRLAGVPVGFVDNLRFDTASNQAVVTMKLDKSLALPADTAALVVQVGLLGEKFIKLEPGADDEKFLSDGDELEYIQDSVLVLDLLEKLVQDVEARRRARRALVE